MILRPEEDKARAARIEERLLERGLYAVARRVSVEHHVFLGEVLSTSQKKPFVRARHALWRTLHDECGLSWPLVADIFEKRHDSIVHATAYAESRAEAAVEAGVVRKIARYVRDLGYGVLAGEIETGAWRERPRCVVPSCLHAGIVRYGKRCYEHRDVRRKETGRDERAADRREAEGAGGHRAGRRLERVDLRGVAEEAGGA